MHYVLMVVGTGLIIAGFALPPYGLDPLSTATLFVSGTAALSSGLAAYEIIAALRDRNELPGRRYSGE